MAVQNSFGSHLMGLPSGAKRRKARPGADGPRGPASRGSLARRSRPGMGREARRGRKGGPLSTSRNKADRPGRGVPPGCRRAGHLLCRPSSACRFARLPRAFANLLRPGGQRAESPREAGPPARKLRRPHRKRTQCTLRMRTPKADEAGGPSPPAHPWRVGWPPTTGKAGAGARRAAEGLRPERVHARVDAPGEGPQRRAKGAAQTQP